MTEQSDTRDKEFEGLADYAPELAAAIAAIAGDVALVIDRDGIVRNVATGTGAAHPASEQWVGMRWADTATPETRRKIDLLLTEAHSGGVSKRREVNHPSNGGSDIPMTYAAVRLGEGGPVLVAGRDLRAISAIQQRFIESQQEMERSYWVQRQAEAHYRLLFQVATDAVLVVDAQSMLVVDANPAAHRMFSAQGSDIIGMNVAMHVDVRSRPNINEMLAAARATGKAAELTVRLSASSAPAVISATPFRGERDMLLLLRISLAEQPGSTVSNGTPATRGEPVDAVVITDSSGRIKMSNPAFLELIGAGGEAQIKGQELSRWVAGFDLQLDGVLDLIKRHGIATRSTSVLRPNDQATVEVELSAALLTGGEQLHIGISLRRRSSEAAPRAAKQHDLSEQISALVATFGQLSLDQLLIRVAQLAEQQFVQQALDQSGGDKSAAARLLQVTTARIRKQSRPANSGRDSDPTLH